MGWTSSTSWKTKDCLKAHLIDELRFNDGVKILKTSVVGNNIWYLIEDKDSKNVSIHLDVMAKFGEGEWGYKPISESMGPNEINCPISFIKTATPTNHQFAAEWREKVRKYHEIKASKSKIKLEPGLIINYGGLKYELLENLGRKGWFVKGVLNQVKYRMRTTQMSVVLKDMVSA